MLEINCNTVSASSTYCTQYTISGVEYLYIPIAVIIALLLFYIILYIIQYKQ